MSFTIPDIAAAWNAIQARFQSGDLEILAAGSAGVGVISGCAVSPQGTPNMTVAVASGTVQIGGSSVAVTSGNVTITANSSGNPRLDLICVNGSGTKSAQAGTAAAAPKYPAIPGSSTVLAAVLVPTGAASITSNNIVDKRMTVPPTTGLLVANNLSDLASVPTARTNLGLGTMAVQNASGVAITGGTATGFPTPTGASDVAIKSYVDALVGSSGARVPVRVATTANITLSGSQAIDGVSVVAGDRVLVKNQSTGSQNGIYVAASGAWARAGDADASAEIVPGMLVTTTGEGTTNGGRIFTLTTNGTITLGSTSLLFAPLTLPVGTTTNTVAAGDDARITTINFEVGGRVGTLTAETAGTTKTPRLYNRTGRTWTISAVYCSVDTAPTGSGITVVVRKNGSGTGAISTSISATANTGSTTGQSLSVADGDYLQAWPTAVGSTIAGTDLSVLLVGTTA